MLTLRIKLLNGLDGVLAVALAGLVLGTTLAFGGAVWWARPAIVGARRSLLVAGLPRSGSRWPGRCGSSKSPLTLLGIAGLCSWGRPARAACRPALARGSRPGRSRSADRDPARPGPRRRPVGRAPAAVRCGRRSTLDRPATLRWLAGRRLPGAVLVASQFADRLGQAYVVWGSVVAAFFLNTAFAVVQVSLPVRRALRAVQAGDGPVLGPVARRPMTAPRSRSLRPVGDRRPDGPALASAEARPAVPDREPDGRPGGFLALARLALPLAFGLMLQMLAPRGSREGLLARLRDSGQGSLVLLLLGLLVAGAVLVGLMAGPLLSLPFAVGLALVGLPGAWPTGLRMAGLAADRPGPGAPGGRAWRSAILGRGCPGPRSPVPRLDWDGPRGDLGRALPILADFPVLGTGLGTFPAVHPYYKTRDAATEHRDEQPAAMVGRVGGRRARPAGDGRALVPDPAPGRDPAGRDGRPGAGLRLDRGAGQLQSILGGALDRRASAVALAASAVGGTWNRWLAGGTDLFVERG